MPLSSQPATPKAATPGVVLYESPAVASVLLALEKAADRLHPSTLDSDAGRVEVIGATKLHSQLKRTTWELRELLSYAKVWGECSEAAAAIERLEREQA